MKNSSLHTLLAAVVALTVTPAVAQQTDFRSAIQQRNGVRPAANAGQRKVQFRLPRNASGANRITSTSAERLARLRALKDQSRTATKGVGKPYAPGSRYQQLLRANRGITTTAGTANMQRPVTRVGKLSETPRTARPNTRSAPMRRTASNVRPRTNLARTASNVRPNTRTGGIARTASNVRPNTRTGGIARTATKARPVARLGGIARTATSVRPPTVPAGSVLKTAAKGTVVAAAGTAVLNDLTGTDPFDLGVKAVGDVIHGTNNAEQTLNNVEASFNKSLIKQTFVDPAAAGKRVERDAVKTVNDIGTGIQDAGNAIGSLFGG